jgi:GT2 family glycosyltransferase
MIFGSTYHQNIPLVSVVIVNQNGSKIIGRCLRSILESSYPKIEVIVFDNGSTDNSIQIIRNNFPKVIIIENKKSIGFAEANNLAVEKSNGDIIFLLNNDTSIDKRCIEEIVKIFQIFPKIGIVGAVLVYYGTNIIQNAGLRLHPGGYDIPIENLKILNAQRDDIIPVDYVCGAALAIKRDVINKVGLFDPKYFAYWEDVDLCKRVLKAGYKIVVTKKAIVHHFVSFSWRHKYLHQAYLIEKNRLYYMFKHYRGFELLSRLTYWQIEYFKLKTSQLLQGRLALQKRSRILMPKQKYKTLIILNEILRFIAIKLFVYLMFLIKGPLLWSD